MQCVVDSDAEGYDQVAPQAIKFLVYIHCASFMRSGNSHASFYRAVIFMIMLHYFFLKEKVSHETRAIYALL